MIQPIKRISVSEQVFLQMKGLILDKQWEPGSKLPSEGELCSLFEVSRVTVRGALHKLAALGLIDTQLGDGSYVKKIDAGIALNNLIPVFYLEEDVESILEYRKEIESGTCAIAAGKATPQDVLALRQMLDKMLTLQQDLEALSQADLEFHYMIATISRNSLIQKTYDIISDIYAAHMQGMVLSMGGEIGVVWHGKIVDAIEAGDRELARSYMAEHIAQNQAFIHKSRTAAEAELPLR